MITIPAGWQPLIGVRPYDPAGSSYAADGKDQHAEYDDLVAVKTLASTPTVGNAIHADANCAILEAVDANVKWRQGADPTAAIGNTIIVGSPMIIENARDFLLQMRFIQAAAGAKLKVTYGRV